MTIKQINAEDTWKIRQVAMWPGKPLEFVKVKNDHSGTHFGLFYDNELTSVISCFEEGGEMQFRKLATLPEYQRKGYASQLLGYILNVARQKGIKRVWCNARLNKKSFYEKFGLEDTKKRYFREGIGFTIMEVKFLDSR